MREKKESNSIFVLKHKTIFNPGEYTNILQKEIQPLPSCGSLVSPEEGTRESTTHNTFNHLHIGAQVQPHAHTRRPHTRSALPEFPFAF